MWDIKLLCLTSSPANWKDRLNFIVLAGGKLHHFFLTAACKRMWFFHTFLCRGNVDLYLIVLALGCTNLPVVELFLTCNSWLFLWNAKHKQNHALPARSMKSPEKTVVNPVLVMLWQFTQEPVKVCHSEAFGYPLESWQSIGPVTQIKPWQISNFSASILSNVWKVTCMRKLRPCTIEINQCASA